MRTSSVRRLAWVVAMSCTLVAPSLAATFNVTDKSDAGPGSLRQAITDANLAPGPHTIQFALPGSGVQVISLASNLPSISVEVSIDGTTQPGYAGAPLIEIACFGSFGVGFEMHAGGSVRGLAIHSCANGVYLTGSGIYTVKGNYFGTDASGSVSLPNNGSVILGSSNSGSIIGGPTAADGNVIVAGYAAISMGGPGVTVQGNLIGLDVSGTMDLHCAIGIQIAAGDGAVIGGSGVGEGNVISGCENGIDLNDSDDVVIQGNRIGTNAAGTAAIGNDIGIQAGLDSNLLLGGTVPGAGNLISGNRIGLKVQYQSGALIQGNWIGTDVTGTLPLPNAEEGILWGPTTPVLSNVIGTATKGGPGGNVIAFNGGVGIRLEQGGFGTTIHGNSIHSNRDLGVKLGPGSSPLPNDAGDGDAGANNLQNFPLVASVAQEGPDLRVVGTLDSATSTLFDIDFYANPACLRFPGDFLQGETWIGGTGVTTDGSGHASFDVVLAGVTAEPGARVSSTATDPSGSTSEFSQRIVFSSSPRGGSPAGQDVLVTGTQFELGATVTIGGIPATNVVVTDANSLTAHAPALPAGTVHDLTVTNPSGVSGTASNAYVSQFLDEAGLFEIYIDSMFANGLTAGCGAANYCPTGTASRAQMAVFLLRGKYGVCYAPPPATGGVFLDVPAGSFAADWIEALAALGITGGCGGGNYCPSDPVTRQTMAVLLLKSVEEASYAPPTCQIETFADVPCSSPFAPWIYELVARSITAGCGGGNYCPVSSVTRGQMSALLQKTFRFSL